MMSALLLLLPALAVSPPVFTSETEQVRVDVAVSRDGQPATGLPAEAFEVRDNGALRKVELVSREERSVHAVLVLDQSDSLRPPERAALKRAAAAFLTNLDATDRATLISFTHDLRLVSGPAAPATVLAALDNLGDSGGTALYDAVYAGLTLAGGAAGRPFVLVFTDGQDQVSWLAEDKLLQAARTLEATVYVVSTEDWPERDGGPRIVRLVRFDRPTRASGLVETGSRDTLRTIVAETGGQLLTGRARDSFEDDFIRVLAEVKNRYLLVYDAPGGKPGWHKLDVRVKKHKGEVRARRGYFAH
jgi:VWFA-related protein